MQEKQIVGHEFFLLRCRESQKIFRVYWQSGTTDLANYQTKYHLTAHHKNMRPENLTLRGITDKQQSFLQKTAYNFHTSKWVC